MAPSDKSGGTEEATGGEGGQDPSPSTHFVFTNKVFHTPGARFNLAHDTGEPVLNVHLGDVWGKVPFRTLRESFNIDEKSQDGRLLGVVEKSLKFVKEIRPGDSIPREILDGSASWRVEERHVAIARGRLTLQLVSWITGKDEDFSDRFRLQQLVDDPQVKLRAQEAFSKLAKQFGLPEERKQEIVDKVEALARELSYIEALRDRYALVQKIFAKLAQGKRTFKGDNQILADISRMQALAKSPLANFDDAFTQVDGQCSEVMAMLRTFDAQVSFIRRMRDELHTNLMLWDETIAEWDGKEMGRDADSEMLLKRLYQFLAQHFLISKVWSRGGG